MVQGKIHPPPPVSTPRLAPWEHVELLVQRLDRLIALIEAWAPTAPPPVPPVEWPGWEPVITKLEEIITKLDAAVPWVAKEPEEIFKRAIRAAGTFYSDKMVNWSKGKRLLLRVDSSLDQAIQIQTIGNIGNTVNGAVDINTPQPCTAGGKISIGLAWDDWHPYIGCEITVAVAPTTGTLTISAVVQE